MTADMLHNLFCEIWVRLEEGSHCQTCQKGGSHQVWKLAGDHSDVCCRKKVMARISSEEYQTVLMQSYGRSKLVLGKEIV